MAPQLLKTLPVYLLLAATTLVGVNAAETNQTIDDLFTTSPDGKTKLTFSGGWGLGQECAECLVKPDAGQAHAGSWHDTTASATQQRTFEFDFTGTALYVFGIMANTIPATNETATTLNFVLDGKPSGNFKHTPSKDPNVPQYEYNVLVYSAKGLPNTAHKFNLKSGGAGSDPSLVLFDYLVFTQDTGNTGNTGQTSQTSQNPSSTNPGSGSTTALQTSASDGVTTPLPTPTPSNTADAPQDAPPNPNGSAARYSGYVGALAGGLLGAVGLIALL